MASIDQQLTNRAVEEMGDRPVPDTDIELLVRSGIKLLGQGGLDVIKQALDTSQDPAQVVGQFMAQLIMKMGEEIVGQLQLDPRAFLAKGGFLEEMLDYLEQKLMLPPEFSDQVYGEVVEIVKAVVMQGDEQMAAASPEQQAPQQPGLQGMGGM